jgi:hypothetical protein
VTPLNNRLASIVFLAGAAATPAATSPGLGAGPAEAASTVITLTPGTRPPAFG